MAKTQAGLDLEHERGPIDELDTADEFSPGDQRESSPGHEPESRPEGELQPGLPGFETNGKPESEPELGLELVLIRHGHTLWNKEHRYLGSTDLALLPESKAELAALRQQPELAGNFWRVYCSDMRRCRETLGLIAPALVQTAIYDSRLREMGFGAWEGKTYEQLQQHPRYRSWIDDPAAVTPPDGEAWSAFTGRVEHFWSGLLQTAAAAATAVAAAPSLKNSSQAWPLRVLIVTHGGVIRQLLARTTEGRSFRDTAAPPPGTAATVRLQLQGGQWRLASS